MNSKIFFWKVVFLNNIPTVNSKKISKCVLSHSEQKRDEHLFQLLFRVLIKIVFV